MCQTCRFRQVLIIQLEWWRYRSVQYFQFMAQHFDFAGLQIVVNGAVRAIAYDTCDAQTEFVTYGLSDFEHLCTIWIANDLYQTFAVTQIDENHTTVIAATMNPATQADGLAQ